MAGNISLAQQVVFEKIAREGYNVFVTGDHVDKTNEFVRSTLEYIAVKYHNTGIVTTIRSPEDALAMRNSSQIVYFPNMSTMRYTDMELIVHLCNGRGNQQMGIYGQQIVAVSASAYSDAFKTKFWTGLTFYHRHLYDESVVG